jgi:hypothetical protein
LSFVLRCLKKTQNCADFKKHSKKYKYHRQAATYTDGAKALINKPVIFYFVTIEDKPPYGVIVYKFADEIIELGREANLDSIERYKNWDGKIRGYEQGIHLIDDVAYYL